MIRAGRRPSEIATRAAMLLALAACSGGARRHALDIEQASAGRGPIPLVTETDPRISLGEAYAVQRELVQRALRKDRIAGFKAAATSAKGQQRLGLSTPILGVLLESGRRAPGVDVALEDYRMLVLETELGYRFREPVRERMETLEELRACVVEIVMVVELADAGFDPKKELRAADFIAANAGSAAFLVAGSVPLDADLTGFDVTLDREGQVVSRGRASETLGDPWEALRWTVDAALAQGYVIEAGQVVITGAIGEATPARPGRYRAIFGPFGDVRFSVH